MVRIPPGVRSALQRAYTAGWMSFASRWPIGTNVYEREWDALVVLDACRVDALRAVAPEYDFIETVDSIRSVGSTSHEWIAQTFRRKYQDEIQKTAYVTANAFAKRVIENRNLPAERALVDWNVVDPDEFLLLDQAWEHQPEHPYKHMLSEHLTDRAITVGRDVSPPKLIVHYLQPHVPYIAAAHEEGRELDEFESNPFDALRRNQIDRESVWKAYLQDLRMGLDSITLLLRNLDAERVVITSDHGEAFGEWGVYGHPAGFPHPAVKRVPWVETTAVDEGKYEPSFEYSTANGAEVGEVKQQLQDLGYL